MTDHTDDLFSIAGKTALVTGGGQGIGRMIAEGFVTAGVRTVIASRKQAVVEATAAELNALGGGECIPLSADLSTPEECDRLAAEVTDLVDGVLPILVNNAGANWGAPYEEFPADAWDRVLDLNVKGVFLLTRALTPALVAAASDEDPARVINIGSIDGLRVPEMPTWAYSASKSAVHQLTRTLARHLAPRRVTVNAIAPGPFESKMMAATLDAFGEMIVATNPLGRIGRASDMAGITRFLCSRAGSYLTGTVIPVDGGISTTA